MRFNIQLVRVHNICDCLLYRLHLLFFCQLAHNRDIVNYRDIQLNRTLKLVRTCYIIITLRVTVVAAVWVKRLIALRHGFSLTIRVEFWFIFFLFVFTFQFLAQKCQQLCTFTSVLFLPSTSLHVGDQRNVFLCCGLAYTISADSDNQFCYDSAQRHAVLLAILQGENMG